MSEITASRTDTAYPLITKTRDGAGGPLQAGNTVVQSVYDPAADQWMNMSTGAWQPTQDTAAKSEPEPGVHVRNVTWGQVPANTDKVIALSEVTAGPLVGLFDIEVVRFDDAPSASEVASQVDTTLSGTHGAGNWEGGGGLTEQSIWEYVLTANDSHLVAGGAAEALFGAGGGFSPAQVADELLGRLVADWELETGSVGQVLYNLDSDSLRLLLEAALGKLTRFGKAYLSWPCQKLFAGDIGEVFRRPVIINGALADLTGASIQWRFIALDDGTEVLKTGTVSGTPGHCEYETAAADGIIDAARNWRAYARATLPGGEVKTSERMLVIVEAVV